MFEIKEGEKIPKHITDRSNYARKRNKNLYQNVKVVGEEDGFLMFEPEGEPVLVDKCQQ
jgi:hypothetical protein